MTSPLEHACILFALKRERRAFHRHFPIKQKLLSPCWAALCGARPVLALQTGVGTTAMQSALDWLFDNHRPKLILSAGYAGALHDDLKVGDTMLVSRVLDSGGEEWPVPWPGESYDCPLLTMPHFIATPEEKRDLAIKHRARIVDMESAVVARECAKRGIPFGCLRAISDTVEPALSPQIVRLLSNGRVPVGRLSLAILRKPGLVPELIRLARQTRLASFRLGEALADLLKKVS